VQNSILIEDGDGRCVPFELAAHNALRDEFALAVVEAQQWRAQLVVLPEHGTGVSEPGSKPASDNPLVEKLM
jgi:hypothetical protein